MQVRQRYDSSRARLFSPSAPVRQVYDPLAHAGWKETSECIVKVQRSGKAFRAPSAPLYVINEVANESKSEMN